MIIIIIIIIIYHHIQIVVTVKHNEIADWIQKVAEELQSNMQQNIEITPTKIK